LPSPAHSTDSSTLGTSLPLGSFTRAPRLPFSTTRPFALAFLFL
jgi:hypothetical protein